MKASRLAVQLLNPDAQAALERTFLDLLRRRHPDLVWTIDRPRKGRKRAAPSPAGEIVGGLAPKQKQRPALDRGERNPDDPPGSQHAYALAYGIGTRERLGVRA